MEGVTGGDEREENRYKANIQIIKISRQHGIPRSAKVRFAFFLDSRGMPCEVFLRESQ